MPSAGLAEQAAAALVHRHGGGAFAILSERAATAEELGHRVAAQTWRAMAAAAARLLDCDRYDPDRRLAPHAPDAARPRASAGPAALNPAEAGPGATVCPPATAAAGGRRRRTRGGDGMPVD
jgi:hypothetical protein